MRKILFFAALFSCCQSIFASTYRVEIAVFDQSVATDYFYTIENVKLAIDANELYRYYVGDLDDAIEAKKLKEEFISKGYKYAKVVDLKKERANCAVSCKAPLYVENIFFDFDRSDLRQKSRNDLGDLVTLMQENPDYKVELSAHTDTHGSLEYNTALSKRRSSEAKKYLITKGISDARIMTSEFGETSPIAKNELNGQDSPSGRQYNRRVVITVMKSNGRIVPNIVQPIDIPVSLRSE